MVGWQSVLDPLSRICLHRGFSRRAGQVLLLPFRALSFRYHLEWEVGKQPEPVLPIGLGGRLGQPRLLDLEQHRVGWGEVPKPDHEVHLRARSVTLGAHQGAVEAIKAKQSGGPQGACP